jgi:hypothetical protein
VIKDWRRLIYLLLIGHKRIRKNFAEVDAVVPAELAKTLSEIELFAIQAKGDFTCFLLLLYAVIIIIFFFPLTTLFNCFSGMEYTIAALTWHHNLAVPCVKRILPKLIFPARQRDVDTVYHFIKSLLQFRVGITITVTYCSLMILNSILTKFIYRYVYNQSAVICTIEKVKKLCDDAAEWRNRNGSSAGAAQSITWFEPEFPNTRVYSSRPE